MKTARFVADPRLLLADILPPGNRLVGVGLDHVGNLVFSFTGVDVPKEVAGTPVMQLFGCRSAMGELSYWFEPKPMSDDALGRLFSPRSEPA